ncbi:unnamed protein product, partial [Ectocarpus sp. 6 AP-2014]
MVGVVEYRALSGYHGRCYMGVGLSAEKQVCFQVEASPFQGWERSFWEHHQSARKSDGVSVFLPCYHLNAWLLHNKCASIHGDMAMITCTPMLYMVIVFRVEGESEQTQNEQRGFRC